MIGALEGVAASDEMIALICKRIAAKQWRNDGERLVNRRSASQQA